MMTGAGASYSLLAQEVWGGAGTGEGLGWALSHEHNSQRVRSLQNIKFPPAILSCNIHVDTTETTIMSRFSRVLMSSLAVNGG